MFCVQDKFPGCYFKSRTACKLVCGRCSCTCTCTCTYTCTCTSFSFSCASFSCLSSPSPAPNPPPPRPNLPLPSSDLPPDPRKELTGDGEFWQVFYKQKKSSGILILILFTYCPFIFFKSSPSSPPRNQKFCVAKNSDLTISAPGLVSISPPGI